MFRDVKCNIWWTRKDEHGAPLGPHPSHNVEVSWVDENGFHTEDVFAYAGYNIYGHRPYFLVCFGKTKEGRLKTIPREVANEVARQLNNHNTRSNSRLAAAIRDRRGTRRLPIVGEAS